MAEAVGAAATLISIIGFSAQCFDGCVKGFVLLSSARSLGRDADILRSMLDWEHFRLEQFGEKAQLHDPREADMLLNWNLVRSTLEQLQVLTNDAQTLKEKYNMDLVESYTDEKQSIRSEDSEGDSISRFKRLFGQSDKEVSTAAARVIQAKASNSKKLRWAAIDQNKMKQLISDISYLVQRLHDMLDASVQTQMHQAIRALLEEATYRYENVPDLDYLKELATSIRRDPVTAEDVNIEKFDQEVEEKFRNLFFYAIQKNDIEGVREFLDKGTDVQILNHNGWPALVRAAEDGHLAIVELLLKRGADCTIGTMGNRLPLHFAAENGHAEVVRCLLKQSAIDVNARDHTGRTAIFNAADNSHSTVIDILLSQPNIVPNPPTNDGFTPLLQALFNKRKPIIRRLLSRADVSPNEPDSMYKQSPLWMAAPVEDEELVELFLERKDLHLNAPSRYGETALGRCARQSYNKNMKLLMKAGADIHVPNKEGQTPLISAILSGNEDGVDLLLEHPDIGTSINTPDKALTATINSSDTGKEKLKEGALTPLHHACLISNLRAIRSLLRFSPLVLDLSPVTAQHNNTPLHLASANGHKIAAKLLLNSAQELHSSSVSPQSPPAAGSAPIIASSFINARNKREDTPLASAAMAGHEPVVRLLIERGADPHMEDEDGETITERVRDRGRALEDMARLLKELNVG